MTRNGRTWTWRDDAMVRSQWDYENDRRLKTVDFSRTSFCDTFYFYSHCLYISSFCDIFCSKTYISFVCLCVSLPNFPKGDQRSTEEGEVWTCTLLSGFLELTNFTSYFNLPLPKLSKSYSLSVSTYHQGHCILSLWPLPRETPPSSYCGYHC